MPADDLFVWLDALWNKQKPEGAFPVFIAHRFLASDQNLANAARVLGKDIRDPAMAFAAWQALLPEAHDAPFLVYPAPKKRPEAEQLTQRMMVVLSVRRQVAEEMQALVQAAGRLDELYVEYGIVAPDAETPVDDEMSPRKKVKGPVGLMAMLES